MTPHITLAVLLAGGESRRMGNLGDKNLLDWEGTPLWQRQLATLSALNPERLEVSAPEQPSWLPEGVSWLGDATANSENIGPISQIRPIGPIGGLLAALESAGEGLVAALAVDLPSMTTDYLARLQASCFASMGVVPRGAAGYEPLAAIYPAGASASAREWIAKGHRDLQGWIDLLVQRGFVSIQEIEASDRPLFRNLNTPEDLK